MKFSLSTLQTRLNVLTHVKNFSQSSKANSSNNHYDIIVAGGGMVGFAQALSLGNSEFAKNKKILLLESSSSQAFKFEESKYSLRVCALNPGSRALLQSLGVWDHIEMVRNSTVKRMQIWDACSDASISFGKSDLSEDVCYIVENDLIVDALTKKMIQNSKNPIDVRYQSKITSYELPNRNGLAKVALADGSEFSANLIIGADGYNSSLRRAMKTQYVTYDYDQMAVVATLRISESGPNVTAWQRFLPTGPIAILPLNDKLSSMVWSTDKETAKSLLELSPEMLTDRINQALWDDFDKDLAAHNISERVYQMLKVCSVNTVAQDSNVRQLPPSVIDLHGNPAAFPLALGHAVDYISERAVLIGDAAHRVHPLAGQGVNLGFGDVTELTCVINEAIGNGMDIGSSICLKQYQSSRQQHNVAIMAAIHGFHLLYRTTWTPLVVLRSVGFNLVDSLPLVKRLITKAVAI